VTAGLASRRTQYSLDQVGHGGGPGVSGPALDVIGERYFRADLRGHDVRRRLHRLDRLLTEAYATGGSVCLVHGSSSGNHLLFLAHCRPGDRVIIPRNVHKSVLAAAILAGVRPVFLEPQVEPRLGLIFSPPLASFAAALEAAPAARAVVVTSPTYDGICADIRPLADLARRRGAHLLVDEAHGPHLHFHPDLPPDALAQGAGASVQSSHKVLAALGQTAAVHLARGSALGRAVEELRDWLTTPDVSPVLLLSLEAALRQMMRSGEELWSRALGRAHRLRRAIRGIGGLAPWEDEVPWGQDQARWAVDPCKITVRVDELGVSGAEAALYLDRVWRVSVELYGARSFLVMLSAANTDEHIDRLLRGLAALARWTRRARRDRGRGPARPVPGPLPLPRLGPLQLTPRQAFFAPKRLVPLRAAVGCLSGEIVAPYPPGIPILIPGGLVTAEAVAYLQESAPAPGEALEALLVVDDARVRDDARVPPEGRADA